MHYYSFDNVNWIPFEVKSFHFDRKDIDGVKRALCKWIDLHSWMHRIWKICIVHDGIEHCCCCILEFHLHRLHPISKIIRLLLLLLLVLRFIYGRKKKNGATQRKIILCWIHCHQSEKFSVMCNCYKLHVVCVCVYIDIPVFLCFEFILRFSFFFSNGSSEILSLLKKSYLFILCMQSIRNHWKSLWAP